MPTHTLTYTHTVSFISDMTMVDSGFLFD